MSGSVSALERHTAKWRAIAKDGADLPAPQATVRDATQLIGPGETYDFEFVAKEPGLYKLGFSSFHYSDVTQRILVDTSGGPMSVYAAKH